MRKSSSQWSSTENMVLRRTYAGNIGEVDLEKGIGQ